MVQTTVTLFFCRTLYNKYCYLYVSFILLVMNLGNILRTFVQRNVFNQSFS